MPDFQDFKQTAIENLKTLVLSDFKDFSKEAVKDGTAFLERAKKDLDRWLQLRAEGRLSNEDLEWLIKGKKDLAKLQALKQAGVSLTRLEGFRNDLVTLAINTATSAAAEGLGQVTKAQKKRGK